MHMSLLITYAMITIPMYVNRLCKFMVFLKLVQVEAKRKLFHVAIEKLR